MNKRSPMPYLAGIALVGTLAAVVTQVVKDTTHVEGGFVNNPHDPGGATNHGITEAVARAHGYTGHMRDLPKHVAETIYRQSYIEQPGFMPVLERSPAVGHKLVDGGVNAGPARASQWFQTALNVLSRNGRDYPTVTVDGRVGPRTVEAYRQLELRRGRVKACEMVLKLLDAQQGVHYLGLAQARPQQFGEFVVGWTDHRIGNVPLGRCAERVEG